MKRKMGEPFPNVRTDDAGHDVVRVELAERSYDVLIGDGLLSEIGPLTADAVSGRRAFVVMDQHLPEAVMHTVLNSLESAGFGTTLSVVHPIEANKTLDTVDRLLHEIAETAHERRDPVIALGGGIVGDIAGFAASIYRRGVPVIQCPTTLLSMVDASVGGKTGANLMSRAGLRKNLVGAFWQPSLVLADTGVLESLPERHLRSGLAECLKHALIAGSTPLALEPAEAMFRWTNEILLKVRMGDAELLRRLVSRSVALKAAVVAGDEREEAPSSEGGRALLNLGHTFAHAIETIPHLSPDGRSESSPLHHGEAVALGLVCAGACAVHLGLLDEESLRRIRIAVERLGLESRLIGLPPDEELADRMRHDKKVLSGRLRLILPTAIGKAVVVEDPARESIFAGWKAIRAGR